MSPDAERFYITGGTLPSYAASYIVRQADKDLYQGLCDGEFCYVLNTRQIGKSSLMVRCAHQLRAQGHLVALLDLTAIGQNVTIEEWYDGLLTLVAEQLGLRNELEEFWLEHERLGPMQRWMEAIRHVALELRQQKLFLFVDEIDCVRSLPFATDEFFVGIRECYNRRVQDPVFERLTFCLLGVATPADLIADTRLSPFNIGRRIVLADFTLEEASPLAHGLDSLPPDRGDPQSSGADAVSSGAEVSTSASGGAQSLLRQVLDWTGGHPYLTQRLCHSLAQAPHPLQGRDVDRVCRDLFLHPQAQNTDDNLAFVRNCLLRNEAEASALLDLYRQIRLGKKVREETIDPVHIQLRLSGIVKVRQGAFQVRNRIYAQAFDVAWLDANMADAELRRQRTAYKRGVRAATFFGSLIGLLGILLAVAVVNAGNARSAQKTAAHLLYTADMGLAQREWEAGNVTHVLELLAETQHSPERDIEWDYWNRRCHQSIRTFTLSDRIFATAFSPKGSQLAAITEDGYLKVAEVTDGRERLSLKIAGMPCKGLAYSPDGIHLAVAVEATVQIREAASGRLVRTLTASPGDIDRAMYSADGRFVVSHDTKDVVVVWDVLAGRKRFQLEDRDNPFRACTVSHAEVVTCRKNGLVQFWGLEGGRAGRRVQTSFAAPAIAVSHDGSLLVGGDAGGNVQIVSIATGSASFHAVNDGSLEALAFSADDTRLIASHALALDIWDMRSGRLLSTFKEHLDHSPGLAVSRDDRYIATGGLDHLVKVWDLSRPAATIVVSGSTQALWHVQFSTDGLRVLTCSGDGYAALWDSHTGKRLSAVRASEGRLPCAILSHDGTLLVTSDMQGAVKLWNVGSGRLIRDFVGHSRAVNSMAFSADDRQLFTASDDQTAIQWEVATGRLLTRFTGQKQSVEALDLSADGKRLVTGSDDHTANVWDVGSKRLLKSFKAPAEIWGVAFSPDGRWLAIGNLLNTAEVWDMETGRHVFTLRGHTNWLVAVTFSPDGKRIATSSRDGTAKVWETQTGRELLTLQGHTRQVCGVAFAPKEQRLATVGQDGTLRLWDATPLSTP